MKFTWLSVLAVLLLTTLASCESKPTAPSPAQLAGTWTATNAEYVSKSSTSRIDLVAAGGTVTLLLEANGAYVYAELEQGESPDTTRGRWSASGDIMELTPEGMPYSAVFDLAFAGNSLRLTGGDVLHDFGSGNPEEADLNLVFTR